MKVAVLTHADGAHMSAYFSALAVAQDCDEVVLANPDLGLEGLAESGFVRRAKDDVV